MYNLLIQFLDTDNITVLEYQNIVCNSDIETIQTLTAMTQMIVEMYHIQPEVTVYIYSGTFSELLDNELYLHVVDPDEYLLLCISVVQCITGEYGNSGDALTRLGTRNYNLPLQ